MLEQIATLDLSQGVRIIQARIIDLKNQKISIEKDIEHYEFDLNRTKEKHQKASVKRSLRRSVSRLAEIEKMLFLNQQLLNHDDRHEYQLEN